MSRTYKIHTHKAPRNARMESQSKSKKHNFRTKTKNVLNGFANEDCFDFPLKMKTNGKRSSGYGLAAWETEREFIKCVIDDAKRGLTSEFHNYSILSNYEKILLNEIIKRERKFKRLPKICEIKYEERERYIRLAFETFADKELEKFAHALFMSKGGKPDKKPRR